MVEKCPNCDDPMISAYTKEGLHVWICPHMEAKQVKRGECAIYCQTKQERLREKNISLFKQQLKSRLVERPLPKEDYKRIEKAIKRLEQADVNDIIYNIKSEEENLKKQIETVVRENIDVGVHVKNAYELYIVTLIQRKLAETVGLEIGLPKDQREMVKAAVKTILE